MAVLVMLFALVLTGLAWLFGARRTALAVVLLRPSCDQMFDRIKDLSGGSTGPGASINILVIVIGVAALVASPSLLASPVVLAFFAFLGAALISMLHGPDPATGMRLWLTIASYACVFAIAKSVTREPGDLARALRVAVWSSVVPNVFAIVGLATHAFAFDEEDRLESTFTHPNIYAFFLVAVVTILLFLLSSTQSRAAPRARKAMMLYIGVSLLLLAMTQTRSAWIAMSMILVTYAVAIDRRWLALLLAAPLALLIPAIADRLTDLEAGNLAVGYEHLNSYAWRQLLWANTLQWMQDNPHLLIGNGLDLYRSYVPQFFQLTPNADGVGAHNALLQIYFEIGLTGIIAFAAMFIALFAELRGRWRIDRPGSLLMMALCVGFLTVCYSDNMLDYLQFQWLFWFALGAACAETDGRRTSARRAPARAGSRGLQTQGAAAR